MIKNIIFRIYIFLIIKWNIGVNIINTNENLALLEKFKRIIEIIYIITANSNNICIIGFICHITLRKWLIHITLYFNLRVDSNKKAHLSTIISYYEATIRTFNSTCCFNYINQAIWWYNWTTTNKYKFCLICIIKTYRTSLLNVFLDNFCNIGINIYTHLLRNKLYFSKYLY